MERWLERHEMMIRTPWIDDQKTNDITQEMKERPMETGMNQRKQCVYFDMSTEHKILVHEMMDRTSMTSRSKGSSILYVHTFL